MAFSTVVRSGGRQIARFIGIRNTTNICTNSCYMLSQSLLFMNNDTNQHSQVNRSNACNFHTSSYLCGIREFRLADIGEGIAEVELLKWHKNVGDRIEEMEGICEVQSDKAAVEITSRYTGPLLELKYKVGDMIKIGQVLCLIDAENQEGDEGAPSTSSSSSSSSHPPSTTSDKQDMAVPAARRLAKELNLNISDIPGSGKNGRITKEDVESFHKTGAKASSSRTLSVSTASSTTDSSSLSTSSSISKPAFTVPTRPQRENQVVQLRGFSRSMVKSMTEAAKVPHLNIGDEYDVTDLIAVREKMKSVSEKQYNMKITITALMLKAVSLALNKYPILNSKLDNDKQYTIYGSHNTTVAIDTANGLVVPNIKNVQDLNILEIQSELLRLQNLAHGNKLSAADLSGGTVSVSNIGVISGTYVKALLFDNQAMIIGIGKTRTLPRYDAKLQVRPRQIMNIAVSADHRHCDGATVAKYTCELKTLLENPDLMMMHMN